MKRTWRFLTLALLGSVATYGLFVAVRARSNLVSLNVRDADVREVVRQLKWQTWEDICLTPGTQGRVTLNLRRLPLEEVLRMIGQQTLSRSTVVYPLHSSRASLRHLKQVVRGESAASLSGWRAWSERSSVNFGLFANVLREQNQLVNARFEAKAVEDVALALSRFSPAQVVPEDGITGTVTLQLTQATLPEAVGQVARQIHRQWTVFYVLSPERFGNRVGLPHLPGTNLASLRLGVLADGRGAKPAPETKAVLDRQFEARLATLSPAESNRAIQVRKRAELLGSLPPDQQAQALQQWLAHPEAQSRMREVVMNRITAGIRDTTPDQRVQRIRTVRELQRQFQPTPKNARP